MARRVLDRDRPALANADDGKAIELRRSTRPRNRPARIQRKGPGCSSRKAVRSRVDRSAAPSGFRKAFPARGAKSNGAIGTPGASTSSRTTPAAGLAPTAHRRCGSVGTRAEADLLGGSIHWRSGGPRSGGSGKPRLRRLPGRRRAPAQQSARLREQASPGSVARRGFRDVRVHHGPGDGAVACRRAARARRHRVRSRRAHHRRRRKCLTGGRLQEIEQMFRAARAFRFAGSGPFRRGLMFRDPVVHGCSGSAHPMVTSEGSVAFNLFVTYAAPIRRHPHEPFSTPRKPRSGATAPCACCSSGRAEVRSMPASRRQDARRAFTCWRSRILHPIARALPSCAPVGSLTRGRRLGFDEAIRTGYTFITEDMLAAIAHPATGVVVDATGSPATGIRHVLLCCLPQARRDGERGKPTARQAAPHKRAAAAGIVYSLAYGDQPRAHLRAGGLGARGELHGRRRGQGDEVPARTPCVHTRDRV